MDYYYGVRIWSTIIIIGGTRYEKRVCIAPRLVSTIGKLIRIMG